MYSSLSRVTKLVKVDTSPGDKFGSRYHFHRFWRHAAAVCAIFRYARRRPRSLYAGCPGGPALWYLVGVAAAARLCGYHVVFHHHSFAYLSRKSAPMRLLVRLSGARSTHVVLCRRMAIEFEHVYAPQGEIVVCSNAAWMTPRMGTAVPAERRRFRLGHLGRLTAEKGLGDVLRTLQSLVEGGVDAELYLAGPLEGDAEQRLVEDVRGSLDGRLKLFGPVTGADKDGFFASIDAFIFPTRYIHEAEPLVLLEALAAGATVVTYGRGCIDCLVPANAGLVVHPDSDFVAAAVPHLIELAHQPGALQAAHHVATAAFEHRRAKAAEGRQATLGAIIGGSFSAASAGP